jgi:hypothetical protein
MARDATALRGHEDTPAFNLHEPETWRETRVPTHPLIFAGGRYHTETLSAVLDWAAIEPIRKAMRIEPLPDRYREISRTVTLKNGGRKVWRIARTLDHTRPMPDRFDDGILDAWRSRVHRSRCSIRQLRRHGHLKGYLGIGSSWTDRSMSSKKLLTYPRGRRSTSRLATCRWGSMSTNFIQGVSAASFAVCRLPIAMERRRLASSRAGALSRIGLPKPNGPMGRCAGRIALRSYAGLGTFAFGFTNPPMRHASNHSQSLVPFVGSDRYAARRQRLGRVETQ